MSEMNIANICRICSIRATHSLDNLIPYYMHANPDEFKYWLKPIRMLLSDVLQIPVARNDGLPQHICNLCISYLKHAYTFKRQALDNLNNFQKSDQTQLKNKVEDVDDKVLTKSLFKKAAEMAAMQKYNTNYKVKFVEDDMCEVVLSKSGITFEMPVEHFREWKCSSCRRCFMFEYKYLEHVNECIQLKLTKFIKSISYTLSLKENAVISNINFIERAMNSIKAVNMSINDADPECVLSSQSHINLNAVTNTVSKNLVAESNNYDYNMLSTNYDTDGTSSSSSVNDNIMLKCFDCDIYFHTFENIQSHYIEVHQKKNHTNTLIDTNKIVKILYVEDNNLTRKRIRNLKSDKLINPFM